MTSRLKWAGHVERLTNRADALSVERGRTEGRPRLR